MPQSRSSSLFSVRPIAHCLDLHPPSEVVKDYYKVAEAMEKRDKRINDAIRIANTKITANKAVVNKILA